MNRPAPFTLTLVSARAPIGALDTLPLAIVPNQAYTDPSSVTVVVRPAGRHLYSVLVRWTYSPALCSHGEDLLESEGSGCGPTSPPYEEAGSDLGVSLPSGATMIHNHGSQVDLPERDAKVMPNLGLPDASVYTSTPPAFPITAMWNFEIHDTSFAWAANGLTAEASLPIVNFQNNGDTGYGDVTVTYRIPGGRSYDWSNGPDPDRLTWTEPVDAASTAVLVAGNDNSVADTDNRDVLIVGILLGTAGGALVGAIQELARLESTDD